MSRKVSPVRSLAFLTVLTIVFWGTATNASQWRLWYDEPAENWFGALPVGNGRLGALVFGKTDEEIIHLNEDSVWAGEPYYSSTPMMLENIPEVRRLLFEGKYLEAETLAQETMTTKNDPRFGSYKPLGDLKIKFPGAAGQRDNYKRELDLDTAVATTTFDADGVTYTSEVFASAVDQVVVVGLKADKGGKLSCVVSLEREFRATTTALDADRLVMDGFCEAGGVEFGVQLKALNEGGSIKTKAGKLEIVDANSVTILIAANTSYRCQDYQSVCAEQIEKATKKTFEKLKADSISDHRRFFRRVDLDLGKTPSFNLPTDERLRLLKEGTELMADDLGLVALHFQYGRYLLICSSRPGSLPANLQGIWNPLFAPPWFCDYHVNVNTEMNYWLAENCNLAELAEPVYDFIDKCTRYGRQAAKDRYGCRGFVLSSCTSVWAVSEMRSGLVGLWQEGAGWMCQQLWEHYKFSGDKKFLADRAYPRLKEVAEFYLDYLVEHPKYGWLVSGPTFSPENMYLLPGAQVDIDELAKLRESGSFVKPDQKASIGMGVTMANQIIRDVFSECIEASETLGIDEELRKELIEKRGRLAPMQIGKYGQLQEWLEDFEEASLGHRHFSHLYGLQPSNQITLRGTPELAAAARKTLERRLEYGGGWTGWSAAWVINLWARLEEGNKAYEAIKDQMRKSLFDNMFDNHWRASGSVFQIDGNFGASNAIAEMLVQSHTGEIHLLPALPDAWEKGSVSGLCARGAFEVDIKWDKGKLAGAVIRSKKGQKCKVRYNEKTMEFDTEPGQKYTLKPEQFGQKAAVTESVIIESPAALVTDESIIGKTISNQQYELKVQNDAGVILSDKINGIEAKFEPEFTVWYNPASPQLGFDPSYNVTEEIKFGSISLNYQVPAWNKDFDFFNAPGEKYILYPSETKVDGPVITWEFPSQESFDLSAQLILQTDTSMPKITFQLQTKSAGYFSVGYLGSPQVKPEEADWIWQPLIWQGKRFPVKAYFTQEYRFPIPAIMMGVNGHTVGLAADPNESPFRLPERNNSRFGGLIRNAQSNAQPMLFAPVYGGPGSKMEENQKFDFTFRLILRPGGWYDNFKSLAYDLYKFHDYRKNGLCTLNQTLDNMIDFILTDQYSYWYTNMKTNGYQTDMAGWGRQQSAVSPLSLAMSCDNPELYYRRALPSIEYMCSRTGNTVKLDGSKPFMKGPGSTPMDWAALALMSRNTIPVFEDIALEKSGNPLSVIGDEKTFSREKTLLYSKTYLRPLVSLYAMTKEAKYLDAAMIVADNYIDWRISKQPVDFYDVTSSFWQEIAPMYDILYELYEAAGKEKYLTAAIDSMKQFTGYVYLQPVVPDINVTVNEGGSFRGIPAKEESVPAWRVSANGLAAECGGTSHSHRGIFMAPYAAYMTKFAHYSGDKLFTDIARSAIVGRYANYPSYAYRHGHTTVNQTADYPLRPFEELTWTSEHYNHPTPMATYILDYLVAEAFYRSDGKIHFPSRYTATGAFFTNQVYGDRPGNFYDIKGAWLWMPKALVTTDNLQVNYIAAHTNDELCLALMNQEDKAVTATLTVNPGLVNFSRDSLAKTYFQDKPAQEAKIENNKLTIEIAPKGITAVVISNAKVKTKFQDKYINDNARTLSKDSFKQIDTSFGKVTGMIISFSKPLTSAYIWLDAHTDKLEKATIHYSQGQSSREITDDQYPFEFTVPVEDDANSFTYYVEGIKPDGTSVVSEKTTLTLYEN